MNIQPEYVEGNGFIAEVIRTNRIKTADIKVENGAVSVVVPLALAQDRIYKILSERSQWIKNKIILHREALPVSEKKYVSGESFSYRGRNYRLKVNHGHFKPVNLIQGHLVVTAPNSEYQSQIVRNALVRWYKHHAELKLREKSIRFSGVVGVEPTGVGVRTFKSRWGSCSNKGRIDFNWKIIMAPNRIVDYVVVHELCHLKHHDHSTQFWQQVERVIPGYWKCKEWLKINAGELRL